MKENYKNIYTLGILVLLLLSCSLVNPSPSDKVTQSPTEYPKLSELILPINKPETKHCTVETGYEEGRVNLRFGAGLTFDVQIVLREGEKLGLLAMGDWLHVSTTDGLIGYINSKYCRIGE